MFSKIDYTRVYFDTEFTGLYQDTSLISIGCTTDHDDVFYGECTDYVDNPHAVNDFIQQVIIPNLNMKEGHLDQSLQSAPDVSFLRCCGESHEISDKLLEWLEHIHKKYGKPIQFVSDCLAYDWVLLNHLICPYGCALNIPNWMSYIPIDLSTMLACNDLNPDVTREHILDMTDIYDRHPQKHNALWDAKIIKMWYQYLTSGNPPKEGS